jgi:hypothetical protein
MEVELWAIEDNLLGLNSGRLSALNTRMRNEGGNQRCQAGTATVKCGL